MMEPISNRRSIRLNGYDYAATGSYFITICTQHKEHRFGHIADDVMVLNEAGKMVAERIAAISDKFPATSIDSSVVMPNHIHFIITLLEYIPNGNPVGAAHRGRPLSDAFASADTPSQNTDVPADSDSMDVPADSGSMNVPGMDVPGDNPIPISGPVGPRAGGHDGPPLQHKSPKLSETIGWFKASTTNYYIRGVKAGQYPAFDQRLWQRNYYEHIIRIDAAYNLIDDYIRTNPQRWNEDRLR